MERTMITLMLMYDNGKSHTLRIRHIVYKSICTFFILLPFLLGLSVYACYYLWNDNKSLNANAMQLQIETAKAKALAENLSVLKKILDEDQLINESAVVINKVAEITATIEPTSKIKIESEVDDLAEQDGPGHEEFPAVDTKEVAVENLNARVLDANKIRISLDLRNPDLTKVVTGYVNCSFIDSRGVNHALNIAADLKDFRINRFKRVVFLPNIDSEILDAGSNILIEVFNTEDKLMYRNIAPIEQ